MLPAQNPYSGRFFYALSALKRNLCGYFLCFITRIPEFLSNLVRPLTWRVFLDFSVLMFVTLMSGTER